MAFVKASKIKRKLRLALCGPTGAGKTYSALAIASHLGKDGAPPKIAVFDSENSASLYSSIFPFDVDDEQRTYPPQVFTKAIEDAHKAGYDVIILDSLSAAWQGPGGILQMVDEATERASRGGRTASAFSSGWKEVAPFENALIDAIHHTPIHIIACMKSKMEYVMEAGSGGKQAPKKVGMAPIQRAGLEYEFDVIGDLDKQTMVVSKSRCPALTNAVIKQPGEKFALALLDWLGSGIDVLPPQKVAAPPTPAPPPSLATPQTRQAIVDKLAKLGIVGNPAAKAEIERLVPDKGDHLTQAQAEAVLALLDARIAAKEPARGEATAPEQGAPTTTTTSEPPPGEASAGASPAPSSGPDTSSATPSPTPPPDSSTPSATATNGSAEPSSASKPISLPTTSSTSAATTRPSEAALGPRPGGASDTKRILDFARALDTCSDLGDVARTENDWSEKIEGLKRGRSLVDAYLRQIRVRFGEGEPLTGAEQASVKQLSAMRAESKEAT